MCLGMCLKLCSGVFRHVFGCVVVGSCTRVEVQQIVLQDRWLATTCHDLTSKHMSLCRPKHMSNLNILQLTNWTSICLCTHLRHIGMPRHVSEHVSKGRSNICLYKCLHTCLIENKSTCRIHGHASTCRRHTSEPMSNRVSNLQAALQLGR